MVNGGGSWNVVAYPTDSAFNVVEIESLLFDGVKELHLQKPIVQFINVVPVVPKS